MEVLVSDQGLGFKCVLEQKVEGMSVFQQVTNTEAPWSGTMPPSRRSISWPEKVFEPQTEADNDELIVQGCISHTRYCDLSGFSPYQMVFGITRRMRRSLTNDDELETIEVPKDQHWIVNAHTTVEWRPLQLSSSKTLTTELQGRVRRVMLPDTDQQLVTLSWNIVTTTLNRRLLWWFW